MDAHPIQLRFVAVRELYIQSFYPPSATSKYRAGATEIQTTVTEFDTETKLIQIGLILASGLNHEPSERELQLIREQHEQPFRLRVHVIGEFVVDTSRFPVEKIARWSNVNAPPILFPFLREHVFGLTVRCGYEALLLPLIVLPSWSVEKRTEEATVGKPPLQEEAAAQI